MANVKTYKKGVAIRLPISKHIDVNFRDYALYVLENRGIPSFYDGLTNVQKFILQNAPSQYAKTLSLVGNCMSAGYHHGDKSLSGAINKLARPFSCANQILEGDGFFGSPVDHEAASPRYTSVRINRQIADIIKENSFLNTKNEDGQWDPLWLRVPLGIASSIVGIAVGYKTTVLPRSIEDMEKYLNGEIKEVHPSFINFDGKVSRFQNLDRSWLIEGKSVVSQSKKTVNVTCLPPMMKYISFLKKAEKIIDKFDGKVSMQNNSDNQINLSFTFRGRGNDEFAAFAKLIVNATKMIVTETPVFVKDSGVLVYERVEDYLDDFQYRIAELKYRSSEHYFNITSHELAFQKAKKEYLEFMIAAKRKDTEIDKFLEKFEKKISTRLDAIRLRFLSAEEVTRTVQKIKELEAEKIKLYKAFQILLKKFEKLTDPTITRSQKSSKNRATDLFDDSDFEEYDGISIFNGGEDDEDDED